jgi:hypothetical protein
MLSVLRQSLALRCKIHQIVVQRRDFSFPPMLNTSDHGLPHLTVGSQSIS